MNVIVCFLGVKAWRDAFCETYCLNVYDTYAAIKCAYANESISTTNQIEMYMGVFRHTPGKQPDDNGKLNMYFLNTLVGKCKKWTYQLSTICTEGMLISWSGNTLISFIILASLTGSSFRKKRNDFLKDSSSFPEIHTPFNITAKLKSIIATLCCDETLLQSNIAKKTFWEQKCFLKLLYKKL